MTYRTIFRPGLIAGQVVIVTGGGSGIGRCTAHELAALGAHTVLIGRGAGKLETVCGEIAKAGGCASCKPCDIGDDSAVQATVCAVLAQLGRIDALLNNAGGQYPSALKDISLNGWETVVKTNLTGGFLLVRECLSQWMQHRVGAVGLAETAALEWAQYGVRVNAVAPGYVASSGMDSYPPELVPKLRGAIKGVPLQRMATEAEISAPVVFLLSEAASFITGSVLRVDGGRPQMRAGWLHEDGIRSTERRAAVRAFEGFPLARLPKLLQPDSE